MKRIIIAMAAIAAAFTMASCSKEPPVEQEVTAIDGNDIIIACTDSGLTKTSLEGDDWDGYDVVWSEGDEIMIGGNIFVLTEGAGTTTGKFRGTLPTKDGTYTACYPATYNGIDWPTSQDYVEGNITGSPMAAEVTVSGGKVLEESLCFKNDGGILRLTINGSGTIQYIKVKADDLDEITLNCGGRAELSTSFHIAMPRGTYSDVQVSMFTPEDDYCFKKLKPGRNFQIKASEITTATFTASFPSPTSNDPLPGEFSVSNGRQVYFSKGNLRYNVDSKTWHFFDKQYKCGPANYADGHNTEISLFTWGYNAEKSILPDGKTSDNVSITSGNLSMVQDWGSRIDAGWRTLTSDEWQYLFNTRKNAKDKYGVATVCGVYGLIILPDTFTDPMKNHGSGAFKPNTKGNWTDNVYTIGGNWEAMELAGAVFLPVAGLREGSDIQATNAGYYWTSSAYPDNLASYASIINFSEYGYFNENYEGRWCGCSVRLVTSNKYTVNFDKNGGPISEIPKSMEIMKGSLIPKPATVVNAWDILVGWYKDKECTDKWEFDSDKVYADITLYAKWDKVIWGKFTVNDKGKKVYFTRSNVWADESDNLHFEDDQWKFNDKYESSHISHFFWYENLSEAIRGGRPDQHGFFFCKEENKVSVDGSEKMFYTLSGEEWEYLLKKRQTSPRYSTNIKYHGQNGLVIYDDSYVSRPLSDAEDYDILPYGCVFLPGAGYREGETVNPIGDSNGFYWTSSRVIVPQSEKIEISPYFIQVTNYDAYLSDVGDANSGMSLRLVTNVE